MSFISKAVKGVKKGAKAVGNVAEDAAEAVVDTTKDAVKAVGKGISAVTDPVQKLADNKVFRAIDKAYKSAIPEPYGSYMKVMTSSSAIVGAALSKAKLLPGNGILLSGGQSVFPGHPTYNEITKKGKASQVKAMRELVTAAANTPEAKKALSELSKAAPDIVKQLRTEAGAAQDTFKSLHGKISSLVPKDAARTINLALHTDPQIHKGLSEAVLVRARQQISTQLGAQAKAGDPRAKAAIEIVQALREAQEGKPQKAIAIVQKNQQRATDAKRTVRTVPQAFYRVTTPSGRTVIIPREQVEK